MRFLPKMIREKIEERNYIIERKFKEECCDSIIRIERHIDSLLNDIDGLSVDRNPDQHSSRFILYDVATIKYNYGLVIEELKRYEHASKNPINYDDIDFKIKLNYMIAKKKTFRKQFEGIYKNFKRVSKGLNFPRRNEILHSMHDAFDFDSSKYYGKTK